jgi:drug/metabolite transporter (DMT)-like permease
MTNPIRALSGAAFATVLLVAFLMGANHVAARIAFNHGVDVGTAVLFRSAGTALVVLAIVLAQGVRVQATRRQKAVIVGMGLMIGVQSLLLYSSVARLPVAQRCWRSTPTRSARRCGRGACGGNGPSGRLRWPCR